MPPVPWAGIVLASLELRRSAVSRNREKASQLYRQDSIWRRSPPNAVLCARIAAADALEVFTEAGANFYIDTATRLRDRLAGL